MFATTVKFSIHAAVVELGSRSSPNLDALAERWKKDKAVVAVAIEWKSVPCTGDSLIGVADVRVELRTDTREMLRKAYARLTRQIARDDQLQLSDRECVLTDLFD